MKKDKKYWKKRALKSESEVYDLKIKIERITNPIPISKKLEFLKNVFLPTESIPLPDRGDKESDFFKRTLERYNPNYDLTTPYQKAKNNEKK
jgi:hypothetical protein